MSEQDYLTAVLDLFVTATGRLAASHLDYQQAQEWQSEGIPLACVERGIQQKVKRTGTKHYLSRMPLSWCHHDVLQEFENWRRAVGPRYSVDSGEAEA